MRERRDPQRQAPDAGGRRATDPCLTTRDVANRLGVSTNFVLGEIQDGRLPAIVLERPGARRLYRISEASLSAYLRRHQWQPQGA